MTSATITGGTKDYPIQINNNITNYATGKPEEKKAEGHIPGRWIYFSTEMALQYGMAMRYPEAYGVGLAAGAMYGLYKGAYKGDPGTFGLGERGTTFGKAGISHKLWMIAEEIGIKAIAALKIAESNIFGGYNGGPFVSTGWAFSLASDLSREVCKELISKKAKT